MITDLLYRCPDCGEFEWLDNHSCTHCGISVDIHSRTEISIDNHKANISFWYDKVLNFPLPVNGQGTILTSKKIQAAKEEASGVIKGFEGIFATHYIREPIDYGTLTLFENKLLFSGSQEKREIPLSTITSITIESNTVIVVSRGFGPLFFDFLEESGKKWEDCIKKVIIKFYEPEEIVEFFPRIRFRGKLWQGSGVAGANRHLKVRARKWFKKDYNLFFKVLRVAARNVVKVIFNVRADGFENIPEKGPAILLSNHLSFLDAIILGMFFPRNIWFMAKNSQFYSRLLFWFLPISGAYPVRRYTVDVLSVRNTIRVLDAGHIVGIFPEGERCWDGRMLPFKLGCLRLVLALDQPVIPVGISGAYELMPRWTHKIKRVPVRVNIGAPVKFDHIPIPEQTEENIQQASEKLRGLITDLMNDNT